MCGIAAVIDDDTDIDAIVDCLRHRGPDHRGVERFGRVSLGMVRLAILDPQPRSNQPFTVGSHSIVFNGEIYNFREARAALAATGVEFTTDSDTEVLLRGLITEGPSFLTSLEGMYAFVVLDHATGRLLIGRDPEGIKPLYHRSTPTGHVFASEARAAAIGAPSISIEALREFLAFGSTWSRPIYADVIEFPPGHVGELEPGGDLRLSPISDRIPSNTDDLVDAFDGIVERHLRSDRPVALALSGGFDSALLASRISRIAPDTTTITLDTGSNATDVEGAMRTASHYGLTHEIHRVDPTDVPDAFERFIDAMDQPTVDGFNTFLLSEFTRRSGIPVLLSGTGADEALGGYTYARHDLRQQVMRRSYWVLPRFARRRISDRIADRFERSSQNVDRILSPASDAVAQYFAWREVFSPDEVTTLTDASPQLPSMPPGLDKNETFKRLDRMIYLRCTLLRDTDIFSMASGVEMRVPFVTDAFRSISESLRTRSKPGLAVMFADPYLAEVAQARKTGFSLPLDAWTDLFDWVRPTIAGDRASSMLNTESIDEMLRTPARGPYAGLRKWSIAVLHAWLDRQPAG